MGIQKKLQVINNIISNITSLKYFALKGFPTQFKKYTTWGY